MSLLSLVEAITGILSFAVDNVSCCNGSPSGTVIIKGSSELS